MKKITVAHIADKVTFPGVQIQHIDEIELDNVSGLVFVKDNPFSDNPIPSVDIMIADGTEKHFHIDDLAYIVVDDSDTDETETNTEKPEKYTVDEIVSEIRDNLELGRYRFSDIVDGTIYSFLSGYFPDASMAQCHAAVMKVWKDRTDSIYKEDK